VSLVCALACVIGALASPVAPAPADIWSHVVADAHAATPALHGASALLASLSERRVLPWPLETVWPTAIRYLRVDRGYAIVDKDPEAGFVVFEFPLGGYAVDPDGEWAASGDDGDRKGHGSLELFATTDASGRKSAHVEVNVEGGPVHLPYAILDGLATKLREERGPPPPPPKAKPDPPKGPKKPPGIDPDGPPDDPGQDPTPEPPPPKDKGKGKDPGPRIFE
jgi:hypothetical protein